MTSGAPDSGPLVHGRVVQRRVALAVDLSGLGWLARLGLAAGFAGFIALAAQVSLPLPWTPVPFSFQPLAVLVTGAFLGRNFGLLSVVLYIVAGAVGLPVFADASAGLGVLAGATGGYLFGFALAAYLVGWYLETPRRLLAPAWATAIAVGLGLVATFALVTFTWLAFQGGEFESGYGGTRQYLWLFVGMAGLAAVGALWIVRSAHGSPAEKLNLFLVMMAGIAVMHVCGVVVLKPVAGYRWSEAIALGSTVFLPFDLAKAGLATAAATLFLPSRKSLVKP